MRVHSYLELPLAIPEAEAAPFQVPESTRTHRGASTPEDMISASGIAPTRSRQLPGRGGAGQALSWPQRGREGHKQRLPRRQDLKVFQVVQVRSELI